MTDQKTRSEEILRLINDLGAEAAHTDEESRAELRDAGLAPDRFADSASDRARTLLAIAQLRPEPRPSQLDARLRTWSLVALAASAVIFVTAFTLNHRREVAAQRELAETTAQLVRTEVTARTMQARQAVGYSERILAGLQKLELSRDPDDRKVAIWNDLLPVLLDARKDRNDFLKVAVQYERVLPLLRVRNPDVFLDSYWGELWILNILLDSRIAPVVRAARRLAPEPAVVDQVYERNAAALGERDRKAFAEAITVYKTAFKSAQ